MLAICAHDEYTEYIADPAEMRNVRIRQPDGAMADIAASIDWRVIAHTNGAAG